MCKSRRILSTGVQRRRRRVPNFWLGLFSPDSVEMSVKGGKPKKAFNALSIVMARDHAEVLREELEFELGTELGSVMVDPIKDKPKAVASLLKKAGEEFRILAWDDKKPNKKRGTDWSFIPIKHVGTDWGVCSRRPPYHVLVMFASDELMAEAVMRLMSRAG